MLKSISLVALLLLSPVLSSDQKILQLSLQKQRIPNLKKTLQAENLDDGFSISEKLKTQQKPSLQSIIQGDLTNGDDLYYTTTFYFGSQKAQGDLIFDTSSDWVFVMSKTCDTCAVPNKVYDYKQSTTAVNSDTITAYNANYNGIQVVGDDIQDTVCILKKKDYCANNFRFLSVTDVDPKMMAMDGVVGLAPDDPSNGPNFIATLKAQGVIDKKMFGFMLGTQNDSMDSTITIGGYDESQFKDLNNKNIYWYSVTSSKQWQVSVRDFKFGDISFFSGTTDKIAVLNTFYTKISVPNDDYQLFKQFLNDRIFLSTCDDKTGICTFPGKCVKQVRLFPELKLQFTDKQVFSVPAYHYLTDTTNSDNLPQCRIEINRGKESWITLGSAFLYNYYTIYDFDNSQVGFYLHQFSDGSITYDGIDERATDEDLAGWAIALIVIGVLLFVAGIGAAVFFIRRRNKRLADQLVEYNSKTDDGETKGFKSSSL